MLRGLLSVVLCWSLRSVEWANASRHSRHSRGSRHVEMGKQTLNGGLSRHCQFGSVTSVCVSLTPIDCTVSGPSRPLIWKIGSQCTKQTTHTIPTTKCGGISLYNNDTHHFQVDHRSYDHRQRHIRQYISSLSYHSCAKIDSFILLFGGRRPSISPSPMSPPQSSRNTINCRLFAFVIHIHTYHS